MDNIAHMKRREYLKDLIGEWNVSRLDMFAISGPDEVSDFEYQWKEAIVFCKQLLVRGLVRKLPFGESGFEFSRSSRKFKLNFKSSKFHYF